MDRQQFKVLTYDLMKYEPNAISNEVTGLLNKIEQDGFDIVQVQSTAIAGSSFEGQMAFFPRLIVTVHFTKRADPGSVALH